MIKWICFILWSIWKILRTPYSKFYSTNQYSTFRYVLYHLAVFVSVHNNTFNRLAILSKAADTGLLLMMLVAPTYIVDFFLRIELWSRVDLLLPLANTFARRPWSMCRCVVSGWDFADHTRLKPDVVVVAVIVDDGKPLLYTRIYSFNESQTEGPFARLSFIWRWVFVSAVSWRMAQRKKKKQKIGFSRRLNLGSSNWCTEFPVEG